MILTTPLIERLSRIGAVHVVATPANAAILANHPAVTSVIVFDKRGADRGLAGLRRMVRAARATGATAAYLAQGSMRTASIAWLAGIPERVGFDTSPGRLLYTRRVRYQRSWHHAQRLYSLGDGAATGDAVYPTALRPSLHPSVADHAQADALLSSHGVQRGDPLVALAPGSVWATKRWPSYDALAAALIAPLAGAPSVRLIVLGAAADGPLADAIANAVLAAGGLPVIDATGKLSMLGSAALLERVRVLVTNDSAPLHLASAANTPTVALFGPTVPGFGFGPLADHHTIVQQALACRPCGAHGPRTCPLGHWDCMRTLSVPSVVDAIRDLAAHEVTRQGA